MYLVFLLFLIFFTTLTDQYCSYSSAQVIRVIPKTLRQVEELINVTKLDYVTISQIINSPRINAPTLYFARIETARFFVEYCKYMGMNAEIVINDVQTELIKLKHEETEVRERFTEGMNPANYNLDKFNDWHEIYSFMDSLARFYPHLVEVVDIGETYEGRRMKLLKISNRRQNVKQNAIFIDGTIHAREWVTASVATFIAYKLTVEYESNEEMRMLVDNLTWYILPIFNFDGYVYSWETDRMWRKSRSLFKNCTSFPAMPECYCRGVDLNRNWDAKWNVYYTCQHPCCNTYAGSSAMSEPEVQNVARFLRANDDHIDAYITLHSYGQWWTYPYTHSYKKYPKNGAILKELAKKATTSLKKVHGKSYTFSSLSDLLKKPAGSGVSIDWVVDNTNISISYLIEVRPTPEGGEFCLNNSEIRPTSEEVFAGIQVVAQYLSNHLNLTGEFEKQFATSGEKTVRYAANIVFLSASNVRLLTLAFFSIFLSHH